MANSASKVFIIDDDAAVRKSLSLLLESHGYAVESFISSEEYLARSPYTGVGCIILDLELDGMNGLELQQQIQRDGSSLPVIFVSGYGSISISVQALRTGALTFLEKPISEKSLLRALEEAILISQKREEEINAHREARCVIDLLSPREMEVLKLLMTGLLNKQIAGELNIAEHTVKLHRQHISDKLGIKSVAEIVQLAHKAGLI